MGSGDVLTGMLTSGKTTTSAGEPIVVESGVPAVAADEITRQVLAVDAQTCVETGMAHGVSTLALLRGVEQTGGTVISIDPKQTTDRWRGAGLAAVERAGASGRHELVELPGHVGLPRLIERGETVDVAYVDGWHTFDYALVDVFMLDKMLRVGGRLGINDVQMPSVRKVERWLTSHRRYRRVARVGRRWRGSIDVWYEKVEPWEPDWDFFSRF